MTRLSATQKILLIVFGFVLTFLITETGLRLAGSVCAPDTDVTHPAGNNELRILCLGESTTARGGDYSWPAQLEKILNSHPGTHKVKIFNRGREGIMSSGILAELEDNLEECRPHIVIAMMGINDDADFVLIQRHLPRFMAKLRTVKLAVILLSRIRQKLNEYKFFSADNAPSSAPSLPGPKEPEQASAQNGNSKFEALLKQGEEENRNNNPESALELYAQASRLNPSHKEPHILSGDCLSRTGDFEEAARMYLKASSLAPADEQPLVALGHCRMKQGRYDEAVQAYEKALAINPDEHYAYERLAACHRQRGNFRGVSEVYERGRKRQLKNADLALEYFKSETTRGTPPEEREKILRTAMEKFPHDYRPWAHAGFLFMDEIKDFARAQKYFEHALELNPEDEHFIYLCLADICNIRQDTQKAELYISKMEQLISDADADNPEDEAQIERISSYLALYFKDKDKKKAAHYYARAKTMRGRYASAMTKTNYNRLRETLKSRSIKLVAVQYPMRPVSRLENIFTHPEDIVFVDNEKSFRKKTEEEGYESCFTDHFAGDFGHATRDGNRLLADNIAKKIKESLLSP